MPMFFGKRLHAALIVGVLMSAVFSSVPAASWQLPPMQHFRLSNGLDVAFVPWTRDADISVSLIVNAGNSTESRVPPYTLQTALRTVAWGGRDSPAIHAELARLQADIGASGGPSTSILAMLAARGTLDSALRLFSELVQHPPFYPEDFPEAQEKMAEFATRVGTPYAKANRLLRANLYGEDHPLTHEYVDGVTAQQFRRLTYQAMCATYRRWVRPDNVVLLIVGDLSAEDVKSMLERHFGSWAVPKGPLPARASLPPPVPSARSRIFLIDSPGAQRMTVEVGAALRGRRPSAPEEDLAATYVFAKVLGGHAGSRLHRALEDAKLSDYVEARVEFSAWAPLFSIGFDAADGDAVRALKAARREIEDLAAHRPPTAAEMADVRSRLQAAMDLSSASTEKLAGTYRDLIGIHADVHPSSILEQRLAALTPAQIQRTIRDVRLVRGLTWIIVCDAKTLEGQIRELRISDEITVLPWKL